MNGLLLADAGRFIHVVMDVLRVDPESAKTALTTVWVCNMAIFAVDMALLVLLIFPELAILMMFFTVAADAGAPTPNDIGIETTLLLVYTLPLRFFLASKSKRQMIAMHTKILQLTLLRPMANTAAPMRSTSH